MSATVFTPIPSGRTMPLTPSHGPPLLVRQHYFYPVDSHPLYGFPVQTRMGLPAICSLKDGCL